MRDWDEAERVRQRLAHRLHDGPIQELTAAQLFLDGLALRMDSPHVDAALRESLDRGLAALRNATLGCRQLMDSLRPGLEGEGELAERVRRLVAEAAPGRADEVASSVRVPSGFGRRDPSAALVLYRILEDVLDHVRGAGATLARVDVRALQARAEVCVAVRPGAPFDPAAETLAVVAAKVTAMGGVLELTDGGHTLLVALPLDGSLSEPAEGP